MKSKIVILFGGVGSERLVSVASAQNMATALPEAELWFWRTDGCLLVIDRHQLLAHANPFIEEFTTYSSQEPFAASIDVALQRAKLQGCTLVLALHGSDGEDGELAKKCERMRIAFTGSGSTASHIAFDKLLAKSVVSEVGVPILPSITIHANKPCASEVVDSWIEMFGGVVAKPISDGSSFGLKIIRSSPQASRMLSELPPVPYMLEPFFAGVEVTVGVVQDVEAKALEPVEIRLPNLTDFDYESKYMSTAVEELCPSTLSTGVICILQEFALSAHMAVGAEGYSRCDFIVRGDEIIFLEINTLPGMTGASLLPRELAAEGISLRSFLEVQIKQAEARRNYAS
ncbi:D-alanine--D-alanine ligase [compost metagenome]